ncbi:hypothetical protein GCM10011507_07740 [Edaphobacter acidisoli]|uniref:Uncharacterized protein n=1 Tax=Edaphobacter acidisoli TaxID=2040573 RepID=A0A916W1C7_9BACT|nr:hypothetical protein [Edaphobacter acidisoli]GGA58831.1 hypothetical protein GCM10011507_07740 [Edaphobacter acidisoli]
MERRCRIGQHGFGIILLLSLAASPHFILGQKTPPTLDTILQQLEGNLEHYDKQVPDFFCSEHAVSSLAYGKQRQYSVTDSIFRVTRTASGLLTELHETKTPDGAATTQVNMGGPVTLSGVFSGGLDAVSLKQKSCMSYTLQPISSEHPGGPYIVQFATKPNLEARSGCVIREQGSGRVWVDPITMQVTRMELTAPHHKITPTEVGAWELSIDYAPVLLDGQKFWMPSIITSTMTPDNAYTPTVYSFLARYSNYHKLEVTSHIVPIH